ncbi:MAG: HlyD family efflux transporter periplasmic adaptor subunit, partial [Trichodesmium sp. St15_bin1_1]|nr:HlyD family efflux transporter periplasmic adaptor subunit [Trichodesmium sp. St15_bin1_1]
ALFKPFGKKKKLIWVSLLVVILATTFGSLKFLINRKISLKRTSESSLTNILSVQAIPIKLVNSYSVSQSYTGVVEAKRTSELGFEQSGLLKFIYVEEGEKVGKGEAIAQLDTSQTQAQKSVLIAQKERAIATLKELQTGPRVEVIAATRASLEQEKATLKELQTGPRVEVIAATQASLAQEKAKLQELQTGPRVEVIAATRASLEQEKAKLQELQTGTRIEDIQAARSVVLDLEEQVELAQLREKRREELYKQGAISQEQLDVASTETDTLNARLKRGRSELEKLQTGTRSEQIEAQKARVRQVQSQLDELIAGTRSEQIEAQKAEVKRFEAQISEIDVVLRKSILYAPFTGTISVRHLDEGVVVNATQAVVRLVEDGERKVRVGVPPTQASRLRIGSLEEVRVAQKTLSAQVLSILPEVDSMTRTQSVILALPQAIAPGTIVKLELNQIETVTGYWLPTSALVWGERGLLACFALVSPQKSDLVIPPLTYQTEKRMVEVLHTEGDRSLVRGLLKPGELVVTTGTNQLVPGQLVRYRFFGQEKNQ